MFPGSFAAHDKRVATRAAQTLSLMSAPDRQGYRTVCRGRQAGVGDIKSNVAATREPG
jgi:hypothetical protein